MENKKTKNILLIIMGVLILIELVFGLLSLTKEDVLFDIINIIPMVFIALYGFWLYKKPHGNMLKYTVLIVAVTNILVTCSLIKDDFPLEEQITRVIVSMILVYVSGRLNRIDQNKYLFPIAFAIQLIFDLIDYISYSAMFDLIYRLTWFTMPIMIMTLMIAYFVRYQEHKEAGLADAPKK